MIAKQLYEFLALLPENAQVDFCDEYMSLSLQKEDSKQVFYYEVSDDGILIEYRFPDDYTIIGKISELETMKKEFENSAS